jgi:MYXO-CTERM domain-containing protein
MKNNTKFVLSMSALTLMAAEAATAGFTPFVIRNADQDGGSNPSISTSGANTTFGIEYKRQKAGFGSNDVNGITVGQISNIQFTLNSATAYEGTNAPVILPYVNLWVQDAATSNYFVIAFGLDAFVTPNPYTSGPKTVNVGTSEMASVTFQVHETSAASGGVATAGTWLATALGAPGAGTNYTMAQVANFKIVAPPASWVASNNGNGVGTGAPRQLGTDTTFGFNWIFGQGGASDNGYNGYSYDVSGVSVVPAPSALALLGVAGLAGGRRRRA